MIDAIFRFAMNTFPIMKPMRGETEMDELKLRVSTKFMRDIITKLISKAIFNKTGYKIDIRLNKIDAEVIGGKIYLHADVDAKINDDEFIKIVKKIGLD